MQRASSLYLSLLLSRCTQCERCGCLIHTEGGGDWRAPTHRSPSPPPPFGGEGARARNILEKALEEEEEEGARVPHILLELAGGVKVLWVMVCVLPASHWLAGPGFIHIIPGSQASSGTLPHYRPSSVTHFQEYIFRACYLHTAPPPPPPPRYCDNPYKRHNWRQTS